MSGLTINDAEGTLTSVIIDSTSTKKLSGEINAQNISSLEEINVNNSSITKFTGGNNLKKIILTGNKIPSFSVGIKPEVSDFTSLTELTLSGDDVLTGSVPSLDSNTQLEILGLNDNNFSGSLPALSSLPALKVANFRGNSFTGTIPLLSTNHELEDFAVSSQFSKGSNNITGFLPVLSSPKLKHFTISQHDLFGDIHDFHETPLLETYFAFHCGLTGNLPSFSAAPNLFSIGFNECNFTGTVPFINNLTSMQVFNVNNNGLSGQFPDVTNLVNLSALRFNANDKYGGAGFTGYIPDVSGCPDLRTFDIADNALTGWSGTTWPSRNFENLQCQGNNLTTSTVNSLLSALCATGLQGAFTQSNGSAGQRQANLAGTNASPTGGTSNPEYLILKNIRGWNVNI